MKSQQHDTVWGVYRCPRGTKWLSDLEMKEFKGIGHKKQKGWLASRHGLKLLVSKLLSENLDFKDITISKTLHGKTKIIMNGENQKYFSSISHCKNLAAVAVSSRKIGIDIEKIRKISKKAKNEHISEKWAKGDERIISAWTLKEAIFKASSKRYFLPSRIKISKSNNQYKYNSYKLNTFKWDGHLVSIAEK